MADEEEIDPLDHDQLYWTIADHSEKVYQSSPQYLSVSNWDVMTVQWRASYGNVFIYGSVQDDGEMPSRCPYDELDVFSNMSRLLDHRPPTERHFLIRNIDIRDLAFLMFKFTGADYHTCVVWLARDEKAKYEERWHRELRAR